MTRYFRSSQDAYLLVCQQLDAAYGYPNYETKTERTLPLADKLPRDQQGRVYLAVSAEYCDYILPSQMLPQLLASGAVQEVDEATYQAVVQPPPFQTSPASAFPAGTTTINGSLGGFKLGG